MWLEREYGPEGETDSPSLPAAEEDEIHAGQTCSDCGFENQEWETHCEACRQPLTTWGILQDLKAEG